MFSIILICYTFLISEVSDYKELIPLSPEDSESLLLEALSEANCSTRTRSVPLVQAQFKDIRKS